MRGSLCVCVSTSQESRVVGRHDSAAGAPEQPREMTHPRTKVVLQSRQFSASSSTDCSAYYSCTTKSPVLIFQLSRYSAYYSCTTKSPVLSFQLHRLLRVLKLYYKVASSHLPRTEVVPPSTPRVVLPSLALASHEPASRACSQAPSARCTGTPTVQKRRVLVTRNALCY